MKSIISFGEIAYKIIYPIIVSILCFIHNFSHYKHIKQNAELKAYYSIRLFLDPFSCILCGILAIITKYLFIQAKEEKKTIIVPEIEKSKSIIDFNAFSFLSIRDNSKFPIIHIIFVSFLYTIDIIINLFFIMNILKWTNEFLKFIQLLFTILFSFFILHFKMHRHHLFSLILVAVSSIIISLMKYNHQVDFIFIIGMVLFYGIYSLYEVNEKYILYKSTLSEYSLLFFEGVFQLIFGVICLIILSFIECAQYYSFCDHQKSKYIFDIHLLLSTLKANPFLYLNMIIYVFIYFLLQVFRIITIKEFSPLYRIVADCLVFIYGFIYDLITNGGDSSYNYKFVITIIGYIMLLFSLLIYNEVLIIHLFKMNVNTEMEIKKRALDDIGLLNELNLSKDDTF